MRPPDVLHRQRRKSGRAAGPRRDRPHWCPPRASIAPIRRRC